MYQWLKRRRINVSQGIHRTTWIRILKLCQIEYLPAWLVFSCRFNLNRFLWLNVLFHLYYCSRAYLIVLFLRRCLLLRSIILSMRTRSRLSLARFFRCLIRRFDLIFPFQATCCWKRLLFWNQAFQADIHEQYDSRLRYLMHLRGHRVNICRHHDRLIELNLISFSVLLIRFLCVKLNRYKKNNKYDSN